MNEEIKKEAENDIRGHFLQNRMEGADGIVEFINNLIDRATLAAVRETQKPLDEVARQYFKQGVEQERKRCAEIARAHDTFSSENTRTIQRIIATAIEKEAQL